MQAAAAATASTASTNGVQARHMCALCADECAPDTIARSFRVLLCAALLRCDTLFRALSHRCAAAAASVQHNARRHQCCWCVSVLCVCVCCIVLAVRLLHISWHTAATAAHSYDWQRRGAVNHSSFYCRCVASVAVRRCCDADAVEPRVPKTVHRIRVYTTHTTTNTYILSFIA